MEKFLKKISLVPKGMRYKLMISFCLMSIIPLLVSAYLFTNYIFHYLDTLTDVSITLLLTALIAFLGLVLARKLIEPVIDMALEAKMIANGEYDRRIKIESEDEVGELGGAINEITRTIKSSMEELSKYGERTKQINMEINKKVVALTNLLQIGDAITVAKLPLDELFGMVVEKVAETYETGYTILFGWLDENEEGMIVRSYYNLPSDTLKEIKLKKGEGFLDFVIKNPKAWRIDRDVKAPSEINKFLHEYELKNSVAIPLIAHKKVTGILIVGNQLDGFAFKDDDLDLYKIFARQVTIAMENDYLFKKNKELAVRDELTGLYNKKYVITALEEEIKRSILYQRPCSFIAIDIDGFNELKRNFDELAIERALKKIAEILQENITEIGKIARLGSDEFAMLLPETNKKGAAKIAEEVRKNIEETFSKREAPTDVQKLTVSIGVSENPIDGSVANELMDKAVKAVSVAKSLGRNKVIAHMGG